MKSFKFLATLDFSNLDGQVACRQNIDVLKVVPMYEDINYNTIVYSYSEVVCYDNPFMYCMPY
jgi:hypothetical protein